MTIIFFNNKMWKFSKITLIVLLPNPSHEEGKYYSIDGHCEPSRSNLEITLSRYSFYSFFHRKKVRA